MYWGNKSCDKRKIASILEERRCIETARQLSSFRQNDEASVLRAVPVYLLPLILCNIAVCAECATNYVAGLGHGCRICTENDKTVVVIVLAVVLLAVMVIVTFVVADLLQVVQESSTQGGNDLKEFNYRSTVHHLMGAIPMSGIKIVVVVWQIISEVSVRMNDTWSGRCCRCIGLSI